MISPLSGVLHEKGRQQTWPLRPCRSNFGLPPATTPKIKPYEYLAPADCQASRRGPRLVPFSPEPPALSGGKGWPQKFPEREKERGRREAKMRAHCPGAGAMPRPSNPLSSRNLCAHKELMPHWQSWGIPNVPVATWGFCLNLKPYDAALSATLACAQTLARTREAQEGGGFGWALGGCSIELTVIRPRDPRTKGFSWRIGWSEKTKKRRNLVKLCLGNS